MSTRQPTEMLPTDDAIAAIDLAKSLPLQATEALSPDDIAAAAARPSMPPPP